MNSSNKLTLLIAIFVFVGFAILTMYYYWLGDKLFKLLAARYPKYYKENGEPLYFSEPVSNAWAGLYLTLLLIRGLPKDFPDDAEARSLALQSRKLGLLMSSFVVVVFCIIWCFAFFTHRIG